LAAAAGLGGGIALAFLLELYLDPTVKRSIEIEKLLRVPLFLSIPNTRFNGHLLAPNGNASGQRLLKGADAKIEGSYDVEVSVPASAPWEENHALHPFCEALRERLVSNFESRNLTHKPKLVALTSCSHGAGVSTVAVGLAASLSETGDGNVLLVDMTLGQGSAHPFYKGKPHLGLAEVLEQETKRSALVQENLYLAAEGAEGDKLPRALPKRFANLVPKLKASDYDYIILDLPPVSQVSITPRLAKFMDMVLLVVESEKTSRDAVKRAAAMLAETKATVGTVLNKTRTYVPRKLQHED